MTKDSVYMCILVVLVCVWGVTIEDGRTEPTRIPTPSASSTSTNFTTSLVDSTHSLTTIQGSPGTPGYNDTADEEGFDGSFQPQPNTTEHNKGRNSTDTEKTAYTESSSTTDRTRTSPMIVSTKSGAEKTSNNALGVVFLILILIFIIILAIILYILWKKGRSYSFDLTYHGNDHDTPLRSMEQGGNFEQTSKELTPVLDFGQENKPQESSPVGNGRTLEMNQTCGDTDQTASSEHQNVPEEDSFLSDTSLTPPIKKVEFNLDLDLISRESEQATSATDEPSESQQNENNNNITNTGNDMDVFTEINLDEPQ